MITKSDIEKVCIYSETHKGTLCSLSYASLSYIDFEEENILEKKRELTCKKRGLVIDAIVDDKVEEYNKEDFSKIDDWGKDSSNTFQTISPKVKSLTLNAKKYTDLSDIYYDVINTLEKLTKSPIHTHVSNFYSNITTNLKIEKYTNSEGFDKNCRKVISRMLMMSNMIAVNGRMGPAKTALVGSNAYYYINRTNGLNDFCLPTNNLTGVVTGNISGIDIIPSDIINPNKIILMYSGVNSIGLNVVNDVSNNNYYIGETPGCLGKVIAWFEIN